LLVVALLREGGKRNGGDGGGSGKETNGSQHDKPPITLEGENYLADYRNQEQFYYKTN
jgi:hypothetical protein